MMNRLHFASRVVFLSLALVALTGVRAPASREPLNRAELRFVYKSFDGDFETICPHRLLSESSPFDWKIECFRNGNRFSTYTAHVALSQYPLQNRTKLSIELLYWLTGSRLPSEVGSTTWFNLGSMTSLLSISSSQTVDEGTAGLYLEISTSGFKNQK